MPSFARWREAVQADMFTARHSIAQLVAFALVALALSATTGLAFAGWMEHAPGIFTTLIESGLSWCF